MLRTRSPRKEKISNCYLHSNSLSNKMDNSLLDVRDINHKHIVVENGEPILYVSHDEDDGMWQFLCGKAHETDEAKLVSLKSVFDLDNSVGILKDMPCGYYAERKAQDDEWSVRKR
mgnify:CR=1 FL=1